MTQHSRFLLLQGQDKFKTYDNCMIECSKIFTFGRFTLFIYLEMLNTIAGYDISPTGLDLKNAESSRNGLAFAFGKEELMNHFSGKKLTSAQIKELESDFNKLIKIINDSNAKHNSIWSIETTLCAFKKHKLGKRYVGYYIDRQKKELIQMQQNVTEGVDWDVLWQFREETYDKQFTEADYSWRRTSNRKNDGI